MHEKELARQYIDWRHQRYTQERQAAQVGRQPPAGCQRVLIGPLAADAPPASGIDTSDQQ
jgi:hypothetical protein